MKPYNFIVTTSAVYILLNKSLVIYFYFIKKKNKISLRNKKEIFLFSYNGSHFQQQFK